MRRPAWRFVIVDLSKFCLRGHIRSNCGGISSDALLNSYRKKGKSRPRCHPGNHPGWLLWGTHPSNHPRFDRLRYGATPRSHPRWLLSGATPAATPGGSFAKPPLKPTPWAGSEGGISIESTRDGYGGGFGDGPLPLLRNDWTRGAEMEDCMPSRARGALAVPKGTLNTFIGEADKP